MLGGLGHAAPLHHGDEQMQVAQPEPPADLAVRVEFSRHIFLRMWIKKNREFLYNPAPLASAITGAAASAMMESAMRARAFFAAALAATGLGSAEPAVGQPYPSRPITLVVPYAAGGPADAIARIVAERMRVSLASR